MDFLKCDCCGGVVLEYGPSDFRCQTCGKKFNRDYTKRKLSSEIYTQELDQITSLINAGDDYDVAKLIIKYIDSFPIELQDDAQYVVEYYMRAYTNSFIQDLNESYFEDNPSDKNYHDLLDDIMKAVNYTYNVCTEAENRISYEYIIGFMSNRILGACIKAHRHAVDEWNSYSKTENNWRDFMNQMDNICNLLVNLDSHGPSLIISCYETLINYENEIIQAKFEHDYWAYDRYLTEYIGLSKEAKNIRNGYIADWQKSINTIKANGEAVKKAKIQKRIDAYWAEHKQEHRQLTCRKYALNQAKEDLEKQMNAITDPKLDQLNQQIYKEEQRLKSLGLFAIKDKKIAKENIANYQADLSLVKAEVEKKKDVFRKQIIPLDNEIAGIDRELTKER